MVKLSSFLRHFVVGVAISGEVAVYHNAKQIFLNNLSHQERPEEIVASVLEARLEWNNFETSMLEIHFGYEKARIDEIALYRLLRRSVNEYPDLA